MPLVQIELPLGNDEIPPSARRLIADARRAIEALEESSRVATPAFVPSDFEVVYRALAAIDAHRLAAGRHFVEWGSGVGVVTCLAALVGFDAAGIEIESSLVEIARRLADDHHIDARFAQGSFIPRDQEPSIDLAGEVAWLSTGGPDGYEALDLEPDDFDIVFAYPWPGEEQVLFDLFADTASVGTLLLTFHGIDDVQLHRKVRRT